MNIFGKKQPVPETTFSASTADSMTASGKNGLDQKLTKQWMGLRIAHEAMAVEDAASVLKSQRAAEEDHRKFTAMAAGIVPTDIKKDMEDAVIHVGDVHTDHHYPTPTPKPTGRVPPWIGLAMAAIGLAGAGIGSGVAFFLSQTEKPTPESTVIERQNDVDVKWEIEHESQNPKG